jgi:hypothetical protein
VTLGAAQEVVARFVLGGVIVSAFALVGEVVKPKTFAGIFGAAPSVALATLVLAFLTHGSAFASLESRSMMVGAVAFVAYSAASTALLKRRTLPVWAEAALNWLVWAAIALGGWWAMATAGGY